MQGFKRVIMGRAPQVLVRAPSVYHPPDHRLLG